MVLLSMVRLHLLLISESEADGFFALQSIISSFSLRLIIVRLLSVAFLLLLVDDAIWK